MRESHLHYDGEHGRTNSSSQIPLVYPSSSFRAISQSENVDDADRYRHDSQGIPSTINKERKTPSANVKMTLLPEWFTPTECDVLCGRGRVCKEWKGNVRYRELVDEHLQEYSDAETKLQKGMIISTIVSRIRNGCLYGRDNCPNHANKVCSGFVKFDDASKRWYEVGDFLAREKTSQIFRDALHEHYSSSAQAKYKKRRSEKTPTLATAEETGQEKPNYTNIDHESFPGKKRSNASISQPRLSQSRQEQVSIFNSINVFTIASDDDRKIYKPSFD